MGSEEIHPSPPLIIADAKWDLLELWFFALGAKPQILVLLVQPLIDLHWDLSAARCLEEVTDIERALESHHSLQCLAEVPITSSSC